MNWEVWERYQNGERGGGRGEGRGRGGRVEAGEIS